MAKTLRDIETEMDAIRAEARAEARRLKTSGDYTDKGIADAFSNIAKHRNWSGLIEDLERAARHAVDSAAPQRDALRAQLTTPTGTVEEQLLAEMRASRSSRRLDAILAEGPGGLLDLITNASDVDLPILVDTVTDHYAAAGGGVGKAGMETLEVALQQRSPDYAAAASTAGRAESYRPVLDERLRFAKDAVASPDAGDPTPGGMAEVSVTALGDDVAGLA